MPGRHFHLAAALALILALALPRAGEAQASFGVEGRAGVTFPVGDLSDAGYEGGTSVGLEGFYNLRPSLAIYASVARHTFTCDGECEMGDDPRSSGLGAGLKLTIPSPADALLWVRGGLVGYQYSGSAGSGDRNAGFEAGLGIDMLLTESAYLSPHLGYIAHEALGNLDASFLTFGVGAQYRFR
ncbi:MAG: outer membrane beta-barrel protein [Gemmatimonadota bacterium]